MTCEGASDKLTSNDTPGNWIMNSWIAGPRILSPTLKVAWILMTPSDEPLWRAAISLAESIVDSAEAQLEYDGFLFAPRNVRIVGQAETDERDATVGQLRLSLDGVGAEAHGAGD